MIRKTIELRAKFFFTVASCAIGMCISSLAIADAPNYTFVELAYSTGDLDVSVGGIGSVDIDEDGVELEGSVSLLDDRLWLVGSYTDLSGDEAGIDLDVETIGLGVGWIFKPGEATTIDASVIYREDELSAIGLSGDVSGPGVAVGVRSNVSDLIEIFGRLGYLEDDYEGAITADLGLVFNINERWGITAAYEWLDVDDQGVEVELTQFQIGGRVKF